MSPKLLTSIHAPEKISNHAFLIDLDRDDPWVTNLLSGVFPTGNDSFDELVEQYQLVLARTYSMISSVVVKTDIAINTVALCNRLTQFPGMISARPDTVLIYSYSISDVQHFNDHIELAFIYG